MERQGYISHEARVEAERTPLSYNPAPYPIEAPHFIWIIKDQIDKMILEGIFPSHQSSHRADHMGSGYPASGGRNARRHIEDFKKGNETISHNVNNAALVVIDPQAGEILALVGSADYFDESIDGALDMATSASDWLAFKPLIYALALDRLDRTPGLQPLRSGCLHNL